MENKHENGDKNNENANPNTNNALKNDNIPENTHKPAAKRVGYIFSKKLDTEMNKIEKIEERSLMLNSLLFYTGVIKKLKLYDVNLVDMEELRVFHSSEYLDFLADPTEELQEDFGCVYDCPVFDGMSDFVRSVASASITAAEILLRNKVDIAINWSGGWHHAKRDSAAGFCYVNDIVLAIHKLQASFKRILYIDIDVHHGDAVEDAFSSTSRVVTLSLHKQEPGFFPGTGFAQDIGYGKGKYHSINVPLKSGIDDASYCTIFDQVFQLVNTKIQPDVIVLQCGVDGLAGDPHGGFNLTPAGYSHCVQTVIKADKPVLLLGGGGYNIPNSVRCWTRITSDLVGLELGKEIPDTDPYFLEYGPDFTLAVTPTNIKNSNSKKDIEDLVALVKDNLEKIVL